MKKSRMLAATLCAVLMVGVLTVPAYAGGGDEGGEYVPWVGLEPVDPLPVEQPQEPKPFTPEGTGTVLDNATDQDGNRDCLYAMSCVILLLMKDVVPSRLC